MAQAGCGGKWRQSPGTREGVWARWDSGCAALQELVTALNSLNLDLLVVEPVNRGSLRPEGSLDGKEIVGLPEGGLVILWHALLGPNASWAQGA